KAHNAAIREKIAQLKREKENLHLEMYAKSRALSDPSIYRRRDEETAKVYGRRIKEIEKLMAQIDEEIIVHDRKYHTITEAKNGLGPAPIKTGVGWLQLAHGVRGTASGLRYVLYAFMTDLDEPWRVTHEPGGYLLAPAGDEYIGDVMNVTFSCGWIARENGELFIYYASSDSRCHVATTTVERLVDYCRNTPPDPLRSAACVGQRIALIDTNLRLMRGE
ncbi:MAG: hypothetical protein MUP13_08480, partial [Thermoanaerobaculales bacterium]|nr:hypothetical protein [Thermoanaerobaculales bacterium]